jgi:hypothetical protein
VNEVNGRIMNSLCDVSRWRLKGDIPERSRTAWIPVAGGRPALQDGAEAVTAPIMDKCRDGLCWSESD